jgi:hypothetical protein
MARIEDLISTVENDALRKAADEVLTARADERALDATKETQDQQPV